jgi:hypothetical protein
VGCSIGVGDALFIGACMRRGAEASWPTSMPRLEGTGYQSEEGEGCDCCQLMRGRVKRRKGWSLGCHGTGGREGRCPWRGWRAREAMVALRLETGGEKGIRNLWAGSACWPLNGLG